MTAQETTPLAVAISGQKGQSFLVQVFLLVRRSLLTISRAPEALLLGPSLAGSVILGTQAAIVVVVALLLGLHSATGVLGLFAVIGLAVLLGTGFSGFIVSAALGSGSAAATQSASFLFSRSPSWRRPLCRLPC